MIDEATEEQASLFVLGLLEPQEATEFKARLVRDGELAELVARLEAAAAALGRNVPPSPPPPALKMRLLGEIRPAAASVSAWQTFSAPRWALAASFALLAGAAGMGLLYGHADREAKDLKEELQANQSALSKSQFRARQFQARIAQIQADEGSTEKTRETLQAELKAAQKDAQILRTELESTRQTVATLQARDELSQIKIATLTSLIQKTPNALAVVAWDGGRQRGLLKTSNMPARPDQDYQLWIIDPAYKQPVSAGTFQAQGAAQFKPMQPISKATKFAVSLERKGGVPERVGPIVLISE